MNLSAIRDRLKTCLETVSGIRAHDTVPGSVTPPSGGASAIVMPGSPLVEYPTMDADVTDVNFTVMLLTGRADERAAQDNLDAFLDPSGVASIRAAIEVAAAEWDYAAVSGIRRYGAFTFGSGDGAVTYLGCEFPVTVGCS